MQCFHCKAETPEDAAFCGGCGARLRAPEACPACGVDIPEGAKFCAGCGAPVVAARTATEPAPPPSAAPSESPRSSPSSSSHRDGDDEDVQALLRKEASNLPPVAPPPKSSVGTNMLVFVAVLALLVVGIYVANKGKPPEATMFGGGAPAPAPAQPASEGSSGSEAPAPGAAAEGAPVSGVIRLENPDQPLPDAILFITARSSAMGGRGPPLAVERVARPSFPHAFELGPGDRMIKEMPWQGPLDISARLDGDGNAMTKGPGDLTSGSGATNVDLGRSDVELVLRAGE